MQTVSKLYQQIRAGQHTTETRATIGGVVYGPDKLISVSTSGSLYQTMGIGNAAARRINMEIAPQGTIPKRAEIKLEVRLVSQSGDTSEWIPKGTYFFSRRETDHVSGVMTVVGYDAMLKADQVWLDSSYDAESWPMPIVDAMADITERMGVELDGRTVLNENYTVQYPVDNAGDMTMRAVLRRIAVANAGNWCITDEGKLRLVPLVSTDEVIDLGQSAVSLSPGLATDQIAGVALLNESGEVMGQAGDDSERVLEALEPNGTDAMAISILSAVGGYVYQPYEAADALLDPAAELGDLVSIGGITSVLARIDESHGPLWSADISAPTTDEIEDEYPYLTQSQRVQRAVSATRSLITKTAEEIGLRVEGLESDYAELEVALDGVAVWVEDVDGKYTQLKTTVDGVTVTDDNGTTKIKGSSIETSTLKVNAANITGQLTVGNLPDGVAMDNDIPVKTSDLTNDSGFASLSSVQSYIDRQGYTDATGVVTIINGTVNADYINALGVTAAYLQGNVIGISSGSTTWGAIYPGTNSADTTALTVDGTTGLRLQSSGGNVYLRSSGGQFLQLGQGICQLGGGPLVIPGYSYGTTLPSTGVSGQVFFLISG